MPCVIDATVGGPSSNSYATIAEGDTYHDSHLYADAWIEASEDEKCRALVMATRLLDTWFDWTGDVASSSQALLWPRDGVIGPDGYEEPSDEIPVLIRDATIEWGRQLLIGDRTADNETETQGIESIAAGAVAIAFRSGVIAKPIPDAVSVMVSHYGTRRSRTGSGAVTIERG